MSVVVEDGMPNAIYKQMGHHWLPGMSSACKRSNRKPVPWHLGVSNLFGCLKVFGFGNETLLCFFEKIFIEFPFFSF